MKKVFCPVLALLMLMACGNKKGSGDVNNIIIDFGRFSKLSFNDIYEIDSVISLEANDSSFLKNVRNIIFCHDRIIVLTGNRFQSDNFTVFDSKGNFLYKHNKAGRGPGEYLRISYLWTNRDSIIVYDGSRYIYYDLDGRYIRQKEMPNFVSVASEYLSNGWSLINYSVMSDMKLPNYSVKLFDANGRYITGFLPLSDLLAGQRYFSGISTFFKKGEKVYVSPLTANSIYEFNMNDTTLREIYNIKIKGEPDFDVKNLSEESLKSGSWLENKCNIWLFNMEDNSMSLQLSFKKNGYIAYVDKRNNRLELFARKSFIDQKNELPVNITDNNAGKLVSLVSFSTLEKFKTENPESIGSKLKNTLTEESNPVLVIYKVKSN